MDALESDHPRPTPAPRMDAKGLAAFTRDTLPTIRTYLTGHGTYERTPTWAEQQQLLEAFDYLAREAEGLRVLDEVFQPTPSHTLYGYHPKARGSAVLVRETGVAHGAACACLGRVPLR